MKDYKCTECGETKNGEEMYCYDAGRLLCMDCHRFSGDNLHTTWMTLFRFEEKFGSGTPQRRSLEEARRLIGMLETELDRKVRENNKAASTGEETDGLVKMNKELS